MAEAVLMLALSPTMEEGTITRWHKKEGEAVAQGDLLCEVETDKAAMDYESVNQGTLLAILVPAGGRAAVGAPIAVVGQPGEDVSAFRAPAAAPAPAAAAAAVPQRPLRPGRAWRRCALARLPARKRSRPRAAADALFRPAPDQGLPAGPAPGPRTAAGPGPHCRQRARGPGREAGPGRRQVPAARRRRPGPRRPPRRRGRRSCRTSASPCRASARSSPSAWPSPSFPRRITT